MPVDLHERCVAWYATNRERGEMSVTSVRYAFEAELVAALSLCVADLVPTPSDCLFEVPSYAGIPDLVALHWDSSAFERRSAFGYVRDLTQLVAWINLSRRAMSVKELSGITHVSTRHLKARVLPDLADRGFVSTSGGETWGAKMAYESPASHVVTFEAKLRDWRKGLGQAIRHANSADAAWLALPASAVEVAVRHSDQFRIHGVGVMSVGPDGQATVWVEPQRRSPNPFYRALLAEEAGHVATTSTNHEGPRNHVFGQWLPSATECRARMSSAAAS